MTIHHHYEGGFEMVKQNETRRVMITLSDQAINHKVGSVGS